MTTTLLAAEFAVVSLFAAAWLLWIRARSRRVDLTDVSFTISTIVGGLRLPISPSAGPYAMDAHRASGFARTPAGALLAAIHIAWRTGAALGEPMWRPTITTQVIGVDQPALLAMAQSLGRQDVPEPDEPVAGYDSRLLGWRIEDYSPRWADVRYLVGQPAAAGDTRLTAMRVQVSWRHGDWRIVAPPAGDWAKAVADDDPTTFHPFPSQAPFPTREPFLGRGRKPGRRPA